MLIFNYFLDKPPLYVATSSEDQLVSKKGDKQYQENVRDKYLTKQGDSPCPQPNEHNSLSLLYVFSSSSRYFFCFSRFVPVREAKYNHLIKPCKFQIIVKS